MNENIILEKSYNFALMVVELYKFLTEEKREFVMSKQLLRCGTSIGANINEAQAAFSKKEFAAKVSIASKEARETRYWLNLLVDSHYLDKEKKKVQHILQEIDHIINILTKIVKSSRADEK